MLARFPAPGDKPRGGPELAVGRLVEELQKRNVEIVVVAPEPGSFGREAVDLPGGGTLVPVPFGKRWNLARSLQPWRRSARAVVEGLGADIVHGQGLIPGGIAAAGIHGLPRVVTARGNMRADTLAEYRRLGAVARARHRDRLGRIAVEHADVVVGVNPDWKVNVPKRPKRFVYIPNIVGHDFFNRARNPESGRVLFAGGARRKIKGWSLLATAWPRVLRSIPNASLNGVGWPSTGDVPPEIPPAYRGSLIIESALSAAELAERMARAQALVIPSEFEVSPIILAEAWAMGLPVVAVRVGGIPALATDAAVLVERDVDSLVEGLVAALSGGEKIDRYVAEGQKRAELHRAEIVATAHMRLYEELLRARR